MPLTAARQEGAFSGLILLLRTASILVPSLESFSPALQSKNSRISLLMSKMFKKVLIANRGEIALRVMRACQEMGITPVTVYSDVDRTALHVRKSSESYSLGRAPAKDSYLNIGKILDVARRSKAEAIHPGYGFLSENAQFAEACDVAGVKFIGPTAAAMNRMGSKTQARQAMMLASVPCVPGSAHGVELA
jgi:acetyl/propionyl-CoA carboxylase alpha subunit